jgi:drug/metabolite transporter (DMT)-like permease
VGPDRAGYVTLVFPIIALLLSAIFENYIISPLAILGISLITIGNVFVLRK